MNRRNIILASITAIALLGATALVTTYIDQEQKPNKRQKIAGQRQHGDGVRPLPCSQDVITSLRLVRDNKELWSKPHEALLSLPGHIAHGDRRFKGKKALPISVLLRGQKNITGFEVVSCDAKPKRFDIQIIQANPQAYLLAQNKRGRMKLLRERQNKRFETLARNVIAIRLISDKTISTKR